ncbi:MAG: hypothetical protein GXP47_15360 [Acidobacteria bacterium]|nr:hypothetical protein [Acidobacteriota bacterium]
MNARRNAAAQLLAILLLSAPPALAWTAIGPPGGYIRHVAFAGAGGSRIYVAATGSFWASTDGGASFQEPGHGVVEGRFSPFVVDPDDPLHLWRPGADGTIVESRNGGTSWRVLAAFPANAHISHLAADPWNPGMVDAAVTTGRDGDVNGVVRIEPDGRWNIILSAPFIEAMASGPHVLYVKTYDGFYRARRGGAAWDTCADPGAARVVTLAVDPENGRHLLAAGERGLASSADGGETWSLATFPRGRVNLVTIGHDVAWCATGGQLWRHRDGAPWERAGLRADTITTLAADPADPATVCAGVVGPVGAFDRRGLVCSQDFGVTFEAADAGIIATRIDALSPGTGQVAPPLLTVTRDFIMAWDGHSWWHMRVGEGENGAISRDPANPARLLATSFLWATGYYGDALFVSDDGGRAWSQRTDPVYRFSFNELAPDPYSPNRVFAAGGYGLTIFHPQSGNTDFVLTYGDAFDTVAALQDPPGVVLAAGASGLWRSTDSGASWSQILKNTDNSFYHLAVSSPGPVYLLHDEGTLLSSEDGGATWQPLAPPGRGCTDLSVSPRDPAELLAACAQPAGSGSSSSWGVAWSSDGGHRWHPVPGPTGLSARRVAFDPGHPGRLIVGTAAHGVWEGRPARLVHRVSRRCVPARPGTGRLSSTAVVRQ